jgi:hypothetical protein
MFPLCYIIIGPYGFYAWANGNSEPLPIFCRLGIVEETSFHLESNCVHHIQMLVSPKLLSGAEQNCFGETTAASNLDQTNKIVPVVLSHFAQFK